MKPEAITLEKLQRALWVLERQRNRRGFAAVAAYGVAKFGLAMLEDGTR